MVLARRRQLVSAALAALTTACDASESASAKPCLSFACPPGSVYAGAHASRGGGGLITAKPKPGDCVPAPPSSGVTSAAPAKTTCTPTVKVPSKDVTVTGTVSTMLHAFEPGGAAAEHVVLTMEAPGCLDVSGDRDKLVLIQAGRRPEELAGKRVTLTGKIDDGAHNEPFPILYVDKVSELAPP